MTNQQEYSFAEKQPGTLETNLQGAPAEPAFLQELRIRAAKSLSELAVPTISQESWKYTSVKRAMGHEFQTDSKPAAGKDYTAALAAVEIKGLDCYRIVLVNGLYHAGLSSSFTGEDKVSVKLYPFQQAFEEAAFATHFNRLNSAETEYFSAMNLARADRGLFIEVARGYTVSKPVYIINLLDSAENIFLNTRNLVIIHELASVDLVETTINVSHAEVQINLNHHGECFLAPQARATEVFIQRGNANTALLNKNEIFMSADSNYNNHTYTLEGAFTRNNLNMYLEGPGIEAHMYGFYQTKDGELVDNHTLADHQVNNCMSSEHYKGILNGKSSGVFNGKVVVHPDAQKTNAYQQNNSILLGKNSSMNSKPELVIFADDVKCSHGSTIGQLNPDSLFYLKARGIAEETAKLLLIKAFAHELTLRLKPEALREHLNELIG